MYCVRQEIGNTTEELSKSCVHIMVGYHRKGDVAHLEAVKPRYLAEQFSSLKSIKDINTVTGTNGIPSTT